jgi:hypothetical protein
LQNADEFLDMLQQGINDVAAINNFVAAHAQFLVNG